MGNTIETQCMYQGITLIPCSFRELYHLNLSEQSVIVLWSITPGRVTNKT
jgi:hypothetical protein